MFNIFAYQSSLKLATRRCSETHFPPILKHFKSKSIFRKILMYFNLHELCRYLRMWSCCICTRVTSDFIDFMKTLSLNFLKQFTVLLGHTCALQCILFDLIAGAVILWQCVYAYFRCCCELYKKCFASTLIAYRVVWSPVSRKFVGKVV